MVSKRQLEKIKKLSLEIKNKNIEADNKLGIVSVANNQLLSDVEIIDNSILESLTGKEIDVSCSIELPEGTGLDFSSSYLGSKGYDTSQISLEDILSDDKIQAIRKEVNRPLVERLKWDKWDYIFAFGAAVAGSTADFMWGDPTKGLSKYLSDKNTKVGGWFESIHSLHHSGSPLDYQGFKMGGGNHRIRSIGHDLFGFIQGIWQIKNGTFTGGYFNDGQWIKIVSECNQYGTPYDKLSWIEAIWQYTVHVFCDFFSSKSLPVPGFGYLSRLPSRDIRILADEMYKNGYNLRHMFVQALSIAFVEIIIRAYVHIRYHKTDISKESLKLKQSEIRLLAHSIVTSINIGKVAITKNPVLLNLPQVLFTCYQFWPFIIKHYRRNNRIQILLRNLDEISDESEARYIESLSEGLSSDEFGEFLHGKQIIL